MENTTEPKDLFRIPNLEVEASRIVSPNQQADSFEVKRLAEGADFISRYLETQRINEYNESMRKDCTEILRVGESIQRLRLGAAGLGVDHQFLSQITGETYDDIDNIVGEIEYLRNDKPFNGVTSWIKKTIELAKSDQPTGYYYRDIENSYIPVKKLSERDLTNLEAEAASRMFGEPSSNVSHKFFCYDKDTWMWHQLTTTNDQVVELTTTYEIFPDHILKFQPGLQYTKLEGDELANFYRATREYQNLVANEVYAPPKRERLQSDQISISGNSSRKAA